MQNIFGIVELVSDILELFKLRKDFEKQQFSQFASFI